MYGKVAFILKAVKRRRFIGSFLEKRALKSTASGSSIARLSASLAAFIMKLTGCVLIIIFRPSLGDHRIKEHEGNIGTMFWVLEISELFIEKMAGI